MKNSYILWLLFLLVPLSWYGCAKETVTPNTYGNLEGVVQNSRTGEGIGNASISTNPGTNVILTDTSGHFSFTDIPTGSYTLEVEKDGFKSQLVHVTVRQHQTATARILLSTKDDKPPGTFIKAKVTSYFNTVRHDSTSGTDSTFVEVNYLIKNISSDKSVPWFQVIFKIYTPKTTFYAKVRGDSLNGGQEDPGHFSKYTRKYKADSVSVSSIYAPTGT
jgi:hypothetical protein